MLSESAFAERGEGAVVPLKSIHFNNLQSKLLLFIFAIANVIFTGKNPPQTHMIITAHSQQNNFAPFSAAICRLHISRSRIA